MLRRPLRSTWLLCLCLLLSTALPAALTQSAEEDTAQLMKVEVLANISHDVNSFTQGLLINEGTLYESTGVYGESALREVNLSNGEPIREVALDSAYFGEGLALVGDTLIQLTWKENIALVWDIANLTIIGNYTYAGEGWGLCNDGARLVMSNGSSQLTFRNASDFEVQGSLNVTLNGVALEQLNELECIDGVVYANVWQTDLIVQINPQTGVVAAVIDAAGLLSESQAQSANVLNGIAHDGENFWITGKLWPSMFEVAFSPVSVNGSNQSFEGDPFPTADSNRSDSNPPARLGVWDEASLAVVPLLAIVWALWLIDIRGRRRTAKSQGPLDSGKEGESHV